MTRAAEGKRATIYDVARAAGVSHQTVSRYVKGSSTVTPAFAERIQEAIERLDYRPNATARVLALQRSNIIGVLTTTAAEYGPSRTLQGATAAAREAGYLVDVISVDLADRVNVEDVGSYFRSRDVAGVLALAPATALLHSLSAVNFDAPLEIWQEDEGEVGGSGMTVNALGEELLVAHLHALGHRRFASISGPADWVSAMHRQAGLEDALARRRLSLVASTDGDWSPSSGYRQAAHMPIDFTALVVANDQMALGAILALEERGLRVPEDVSLVGFDDVPEAEFYRPPLTTIRQDFAGQGRDAIAAVLRRIGAPVPQPGTLKPQLIVRNSTSAAAPERGGRSEGGAALVR